ncbi:MAG: cofactor-independent phosphoglycerate mutase [Candidatus Omnitrophota bacterium]|jgi:2,3-bisphosphoglycerate-independent phosphoglycerate mutase|nr:MAG: cofactor-independent phosphoglycerate mutase [Candidatus Omnitrophota bacterium]
MKYIVLVGDGMADYQIEELGNRTPLEAAKTPNMDYICKYGKIGLARTIPENMTPASDVANISILGYNPKEYYSGRGPLEAANLGIELESDDVAFRCNLVTVLDDTMVDYSAGHISSREAALIIKFIDDNLGSNKIKFYPGVGYRHLMVVKRGAESHWHELECRAPHDITGQKITKNFPRGEGSDKLIKIMQDSRPLLENHEINIVRVDLKENPANMIWLWGQGRKPAMPKFYDKYGINGSVISAVDLIKGLGRILGLEVINVKGATGYYDTDYLGKAKAALASLKDNDFVFVHVEAPDEAGHNGDLREKLTAIERFDQLIVGTILEAFKNRKDFRIMVLPDHPTPIALKTHSSDMVPFAVFGKDIVPSGAGSFSEKEAAASGFSFERAHELMDYLIKGQYK